MTCAGAQPCLCKKRARTSGRVGAAGTCQHRQQFLTARVSAQVASRFGCRGRLCVVWIVGYASAGVCWCFGVVAAAGSPAKPIEAQAHGLSPLHVRLCRTVYKLGWWLRAAKPGVAPALLQSQPTLDLVWCIVGGGSSLCGGGCLVALKFAVCPHTLLHATHTLAQPPCVPCHTFTSHAAAWAAAGTSALCGRCLWKCPEAGLVEWSMALLFRAEQLSSRVCSPECGRTPVPLLLLRCVPLRHQCLCLCCTPLGRPVRLCVYPRAAQQQPCMQGRDVEVELHNS
jgi:hypothetical protein